MADKHSVLIKYKYIDYIDNAKLSDADFGLLMRGIISYDKTGKEPDFKNQALTILFGIIKCDIDANREKWEETVKAKSEAGKRGMEKRWGKRKGEITQITDDNTNNSNNMCYQSITEITKITDSGSDLVSDLVSDNDLDSENINLDSGSGNDRSTKQPPLIDQIKKESSAHGFFINTVTARTFINHHDDSSWLIGPNSFLEFCAIKVRKKYPDKDADGLKPIFISAVKSWEDLREEFPQWKARQEKTVREKIRKEAVEKARHNPPQKCDCGSEEGFKKNGNRIMCLSCHKIIEFDEDQGKWVFVK